MMMPTEPFYWFLVKFLAVGYMLAIIVNIVSKEGKKWRWFITVAFLVGCYIGLREWSSGSGRMQAYAVNFDKVVGQHVGQELADAVVEFLAEIW
jgi:hypothetical protein